MVTKASRTLLRPTPNSWDLDELMTLAEAVELHWPNGPITVRTLRTAIRDGQIPVCVVATKFFVTRRGLLELSHGTKRQPARHTAAETRGSRPRGGMTEREAAEWLDRTR